MRVDELIDALEETGQMFEVWIEIENRKVPLLSLDEETDKDGVVRVILNDYPS